MANRVDTDMYGEGYWERAEGSNYRNYADDGGWNVILNVMENFGFDKGTTLVEAACAKGYFVKHARERGFNAYGFDVSPYAISKAPLTARVYLQIHDAIDPWPFDSDSADIICAWEFFEHIHDHNIPTVLENALRVLRPGGELWLKTGIVVPDDHPFAGQDDHDHTHVAIHEREWWETLFSEYGMLKDSEKEAALDAAFRKRDWFGRFFVWRK